MREPPDLDEEDPEDGEPLTADELADGTFRWTTPSGRTYTTEPTRYPV